MSKLMNSLLFFLLIISLPLIVSAAPSISNVSGTLSHKQTVIVQGSGFKTKSSAAPVVWDDCSGTNITDKWSGAWPNGSGTSYNMAYRTPAGLGRGVALPHPNITKYMCGAHYPGSGYNAGYNVMVWKNKTKPSFPAYSYWSYYERFDPSYPISGNDNCKIYDYSCGTSPYAMNSSTDNNWYIEYVGGLPSPPSSANWHYNDDTFAFWPNSCLYNANAPSYADRSGTSSLYGGACNNPIAGWHKVEIEIKWTDQPDGYFKVWDNGVLKVHYIGETDRQWAGTARNEGIGGYARIANSTNAWRYFADIYHDYSRSRVIIGNASTYNASTIREVQVPSAWSDGSITLSINQGVYAAGQTAYLYIVDPDGSVNTNGYPIVFGQSQESGGDSTIPQIQLTSPTQNTSYQTTLSSLSISGTSTDNVGVTSVTWSNNQGGSGTANGTSSWSISGITLQPGSNIITVTARDAAGNTASYTLTVTYTLSDTTAPARPTGVTVQIQ